MPRTTCEAKYGVDKCSLLISENQKEAFDNQESKLRTLYNYHKQLMGKPAEQWQKLCIFYFGPVDAPPAGAEAAPPGRCIL
eukprot:7772432-Pyramimonas_sp.AAC.1